MTGSDSIRRVEPQLEHTVADGVATVVTPPFRTRARLLGGASGSARGRGV